MLLSRKDIKLIKLTVKTLNMLQKISVSFVIAEVKVSCKKKKKVSVSTKISITTVFNIDNNDNKKMFLEHQIILLE